MPIFNLSWKGSPHRRPRINQTASGSPEATRRPNLAHQAAEEVFQKPLTPSFIKIRRDQRSRARKRRGVNVRFSHSSGKSLASSGPGGKASRDQPSSSSRKAAHKTQSARQAGKDKGPDGADQRRTSTVRGNRILDGRDSKPYASPKTDVEPPIKYGYRYSEMPVGEGQPYWGRLPKSPQVSPSKGRTVTAVAEGSVYVKEVKHQPKDEDAVSESIQCFNRHRRRTRKEPVQKDKPEMSSNTAECRDASGLSEEANPPRASKEKRYGVADLVLWEAIQRSQSQQRRLSSLVIPEGQSLGSVGDTFVVPPRTSSQSRELRRFTRELERYAANTNAAGRLAEFTPTTTESKASLRTIAELMPYRSQLRAAGLAVTSMDQTRTLPEPGEGNNSQYARLRSPEFNSLRLDGEAGSPSYCSSNSKPSSASTAIHHGGPADHVRYILADELPEKKPRKRRGRHILPWLHKNYRPSKGDTGQTASFPIATTASPSEVARGPRDSAQVQTTTTPAKDGSSPEPKGKSPSKQATHFARPDRPLPPPPQESPPAVPPKDVVIQKIQSTRLLEGIPVPIQESPKTNHQTISSQPSKTLRTTGSRGASQSGRKRNGRIVPVHETIQEVSEPEPSPQKKNKSSKEGQPEQTSQSQAKRATKGVPDTRQLTNAVNQSPESLIELPFTWKYAVGTPSSFERALDEVARKLGDWGESPTAREETKENRQPNRDKRSKAPTPREKLRRAVEIRQKRIAEGQYSGSGSKSILKAQSLSAEDLTVDHEDRDICDRDVLKGLRMAISAACDEDLDVWLRGRTGLRLRRFLADLKTFESLEEEQQGVQGVSCIDQDHQRYKKRREEKRKHDAGATGFCPKLSTRDRKQLL